MCVITARNKEKSQDGTSYTKKDAAKATLTLAKTSEPPGGGKLESGLGVGRLELAPSDTCLE